MAERPSTKNGERIYAIGDVHGRLDLLIDLLERVRVDNARRSPAATTIIQLGDLIDRGPASAQLVERFMAFTRGSPDIIVLKGNHEATMVEALSGDLRIFSYWLAMGGDATLLSWGIAPDEVTSRNVQKLMLAARKAVSAEAIRWLSKLPTFHRSGSYYFVHAGIRPGISLARQNIEDLLWIRRDFIESEVEHEAIVVHGHTVEDGPVFRPNRIGLDTGAWETGRLTALGLQGGERWTITTG